MATTPIRGLAVTALDCPDTLALADFYQHLLGWTLDPDSDASWATLLHPNGGSGLGFQHDPDYQPPTWPEGPRPQMLHLDFAVDDLDAAERHALSVGATAYGLPTSPTATFRVYADPAGHPFCLCAC